MFNELNLYEKIFFLNIGRYKHDTDTFFEWKSNHFHKTSYFEVKLTRNAPETNIFYFLTKAEIKIVYFVKNDNLINLIYYFLILIVLFQDI